MVDVRTHTFVPVIALVGALASAQALKLEPLDNPSGLGAMQANWTTTHDGDPLLTWVEAQKDDSYNLRYAIRKAGHWSEPRTIIAKRQFFQHPAEAPSVTALSDGTLLAEWIENPKVGSEAEFLYLSLSHDGVKWSPPVLAHKDRSMVQHGLASAISSGDHEASVFWLEALQGEDGPVSLKRTVLSTDGKILKEEALDKDVCACCPTSVVKTAKGLMLAYRDHTAGDIRDIAVLRLENGNWSTSKIIYPDSWKINACPTNAAATAAKGDHVAISWYTAAKNTPVVKMVFSEDGGTTFTKPLLISTGRAFGYTSIALDENGNAIVSWLESSGSGNAKILARQVSKAGVAGPVVKVSEGPRESMGYPHILQNAKDTLVAWAGVGDAKAETARLTH